MVDQQGAALPAVPIVVRNQDSGLFRETVSGADGSFLLSGMNPGVYEVTAELAGFRKYQTRGIELAVGRSTQLEIKLELGTVAETVTVTGESPLVDTSSKAIGGNVSAKEFVDLPSFNRNFSELPGAACPAWSRPFRRRPSAPTRSAWPGRTCGT